MHTSTVDFDMLKSGTLSPDDTDFVVYMERACRIMSMCTSNVPDSVAKRVSILSSKGKTGTVLTRQLTAFPAGHPLHDAVVINYAYFSDVRYLSLTLMDITFTIAAYWFPANSVAKTHIHRIASLLIIPQIRYSYSPTNFDEQELLSEVHEFLEDYA